MCTTEDSFGLIRSDDHASTLPAAEGTSTGYSLRRTIGTLILAGLIAPLLFTLLALYVPIPALDTSSGPGFSILDLAWFAIMAYSVSGLTPVGAALAVGLPGIWFARRLRLTSPLIFCVAGAGLALGCWAWLERVELAFAPAHAVPFAAFAAVTGCICGWLCWHIAERPRRNRSSIASGSAGRRTAGDTTLKPRSGT